MNASDKHIQNELMEQISIVFEDNCNRSTAYIDEKQIGECEYSVSGNVWTITHTGVRPEYGGRGIAKKLVLKVIEAARAQNAIVASMRVLIIREEAPFEHCDLNDVNVRRRATDEATVDLPATVLKGLLIVFNRRGIHDRGNRLREPLKVGASQSVLRKLHTAAPAGGRKSLVRRLDCTDDDIVGAQTLNLLLCFLANPFANRHKPNDACDPDKNTKDRKQGAHRVQVQALDPRKQRAKSVSHLIDLPIKRAKETLFVSSVSIFRVIINCATSI